MTDEKKNNYHEKKADILWEYISEKHTSEIMKRLEDLENENTIKI